MVKMINLENYDYSLPKELIAQELTKPRDHCRLLVLDLKKEEIQHQRFYQIVDYLNEGDVLVLNETKVRSAKLLGKKITGGKIEVVLIKKFENKTYECRIKGNKIKEGSLLVFNNNLGKVIKRENDLFYLEFKRTIKKKDLVLPTPPYVKKQVKDSDYQTVFAKKEGSLAAPTAGLHFTKRLLNRIENKGVKIAKIRLDICYETFSPIREVEAYQTGKEFFEINKKTAQIINQAKNIFAVGTTVVKCLESAKRRNNLILPTKGYSTLFIKPPYHFKTKIKGLITNFHLPKSSLLFLVSAFAGRENILKAYQEAVKNNYRFYSLGDAMLILK